MKKRSLLFPDFSCAFLLTVLFRINSAETVVDGDIFRFISSRRNSLFCQICPLTSQAKIAETIRIECRVEAYEWLATIYQPRTPHSKSIPWGPKQTNPSNFSVYMGLKALSRELAAHARQILFKLQLTQSILQLLSTQNLAVHQSRTACSFNLNRHL